MTDNAIIRKDGATAGHLQESVATIDDSGSINIPSGQAYNINGVPHTHGSSGGGWSYPADGRMTLESGVPVSTTDQAAKATLYFTPYKGDQIALYDGSSAWAILTFTETSLSLAALEDAKNYDIFGYSNAGTLALEALAWTDDTTRATALTIQNGVLVKTGATTRRYLGTIRTSAAGQTSDTLLKRLVWNYHHRTTRKLYVVDATASWTYNAVDWRQSNNAAANKVELVCGVSEDVIDLKFSQLALTSNGGSGAAQIGIGVNAVNALSGTPGYTRSTAYAGQIAAYLETPRIGHSYYACIERVTSAAVTGTFLGTAAQYGLFGQWAC